MHFVWIPETKIMYLLDTNILIYAFKGKEPFSSLFAKWARKNELCLSVIAVFEFLIGAEDLEIIKLESLIENINLYDVNYEIAVQATEYRKDFLLKQKKVFLLDCMIAATAKVNNLTLVTVNKSDYPMKDIKVISPKL